MAEDKLRRMMSEERPEPKSRIVSVRLRPSEYAELERLAQEGKIGPATLARFFVVSAFDLAGVHGMLKSVAKRGGKK